MIDFFLGIISTRWMEILGLVITLSTGIVMPWLSRKSSNYKKIDKKMIVASLVHLWYLSLIPITGGTIGAFVWGVFTGAGIELNMLWTIFIYSVTAIISVFVFFIIMRKSKRMKNLMTTAKNISNMLYQMLNALAVITILQAFVILPFVFTEHIDAITRASVALSWVTQIWWLCMVITIIWKSSQYVYSTIKITMLDGEVIQYDCSPKVCRVHRNYIRVMKRDANNVVVQELQIYEASIKQVEYLK